MNFPVSDDFVADEYTCAACGENHRPFYDGFLFRTRCCGQVCGQEENPQ